MNTPTAPRSRPTSRPDASPATSFVASFVAWWKRRALPIVAMAAIVPLLTIADDTKTIGVVVVAWLSWFVFLVDFVVSMIDDRHYLRRPVGWLDLAIVVVTFPWYLLPGVSGGIVVTIARLARLARVVVLGVRVVPMRRLLRRIGTTAAFMLIFTFVASFVVYDIEKGSDGFDTFGDALWWGIMTVTTVGYGDIVPTKAEAQWVAAFLMLAGVAAAGTLAGSLAAFLHSRSDTEDRDAPAAGADPADELAALAAEAADLQRRIAALAERSRRDG